jgi:hypothetical protein
LVKDSSPELFGGPLEPGKKDYQDAELCHTDLFTNTKSAKIGDLRRLEKSQFLWDITYLCWNKTNTRGFGFLLKQAFYFLKIDVFLIRYTYFFSMKKYLDKYISILVYQLSS